jgi:hypothetical protein
LDGGGAVEFVGGGVEEFVGGGAVEFVGGGAEVVVFVVFFGVVVVFVELVGGGGGGGVKDCKLRLLELSSRFLPLILVLSVMLPLRGFIIPETMKLAEIC